MNNKIIKANANQSGVFKLRHLRDGKVIGVDEIAFGIGNENTAVHQGLAYLNNVAFQRGASLVSPKASWYIGIYEGAGLVTANLKTTTAATVAATTTEIADTNYAETGRQAWAIDDAVANNDDTDRLITNVGTLASFTMSTAKNVTGAFLCSEGTSVGTSATDILFSISNFDSTRVTQIGDVLQVVYDSTLSSS